MDQCVLKSISNFNIVRETVRSMHEKVCDRMQARLSCGSV